MKRLLDRQASLLDYLTSPAAIFGEDDAILAGDLDGIDRGLLRLEARFSHEKRMEKIVAVFPRTFEILGAKQGPLVQAFIAACPPADIGRLANARQFHQFLSNHRQHVQAPPYVCDVAACELACAEVRSAVEARDSETASNRQTVSRGRIRRRPDLVLLRCSYDVRPIFEEAASEPAERDTPLAVGMPPGADRPQIFELPAAIFELLAALDAWTDLAELGATPALHDIISELTEHGLLEVRA